MSIELKIKSKHLGVEAKIIRHEERKLKAQIGWAVKRQQFGVDALTTKFYSIHNHRVWDVRNENRATFLARAYLAGKPYKSVENKIKDKAVLKFYILPRLFEMVNKYGPVENRIYKKWNGSKYVYDEALSKEKTQLLRDWLGL